ncbi:MAG: trigger factor, partial [Planctomycetota bacterium]
MAKTEDADALLIVETQVKDVGVCEKSLDITVPAAEVQRVFDKLLGELARQVVMPGFRRGKVPRDLLTKRYAADIQKQVSGELLERGLKSGLAKEKLTALGEPILDVEKYKAINGEPFTFNVIIEVSPNVELGNYKGLVIEQEEIDVLPGEIEESVARIRNRFFQMHASPGDTQSLPPSDEVLVQILGLKTMAELQQQLRSSILEKNATMIENRTHQALLDKVMEATPPFELPKRLSEAFIGQIARKITQIGTQSQLDSNDTTILEKSKNHMLLEIRKSFVLDAICAKENIVVSEDDLDEEIVKQAQAYHMPFSQFY